MANKRPPLSFAELEGRGRGAILRSAAEIEAERAEAQPPQKAESVESADMDPDGLQTTVGRKRARTHARMRPEQSLADRAALLDELARRLQSKSRLSTYSLRFRSTELEELDRVVQEVNESRPQKLSKNDLARLALNWLLQDYEQQGRESVLAQVLARS